MNEASVSSPLMTALRQALLGSEVTKRRDHSMIGVPDCDVVWRRRLFVLEFKFWVPTKGWSRVKGQLPYEKIIGEGGAQHRKMLRYATQAHHTTYVIWVKKSQWVELWHPTDPTWDWWGSSTTQAVDELVRRIHLPEERLTVNFDLQRMKGRTINDVINEPTRRNVSKVGVVEGTMGGVEISTDF